MLNPSRCDGGAPGFPLSPDTVLFTSLHLRGNLGYPGLMAAADHPRMRRPKCFLLLNLQSRMPELKFTEEQACVTAPHSLRPASLAPPPAFRLPVPPERDVAQRAAGPIPALRPARRV